jgi:hypothetical protein
MDQAILVKSGQALVGKLDQTDVRPRAALWVNNTDTGSWKLWVVPDKRFSAREQHEFYRKVAEVVTGDRDRMLGLEPSDVEMVAESHPAIKGLASAFHVTGLSSVHMSSNTFNGFYLPDGIILRMEL